MHKLINRILFFSKTIILIIDFILTFYITLMMNSNYNNSIIDLIRINFPLLLILIVLVVSFFFKKGYDNTLFNISSLLALITILIIDIRTIFDQNMVMWIKNSINFYYFKNQIKVIKTLGYSIFIGNMFIICFNNKKMNNDFSNLVTKENS